MKTTVQQTKAEKDLAVRLKAYAKDNKKLLKEVYVEAITDVLNILKKDEYGIDLLSSPLNGVTLSFKLPDSLIENTKLVLESTLKGSGSARRLYYTAFVLFDRKVNK